MPTPEPTLPDTFGATSEAQKRRRLRAHFDSVRAELSAHDVATLTSWQRANRVRLVDALRAWKAAGGVPHNYDFHSFLNAH